ncbi:glycosyl hydrolases family 18-domain-containing protein [Aspergillus stella-maris]|uniref:glycosyl hydrolases family 18-domain-containing protein n=1 Tax=Aspergillus stella-maris TaxID=1810926 RepID=UPI003CCCBC72
MARGILSLIFLLYILSTCLAQSPWDNDSPPDPNQDTQDQAPSQSPNPLTLRRRDEFSCDEDKPCANGACCGKSGYCGFGEKYCGKTDKSPNEDCWSNCNAKAECGENAKEPGTKCPLNVCCSAFGFCGTTEEFCGQGCQSNCEQPDSGAGSGNVQERIIGYYEAFKHDKKCQGMGIREIPVESLTHVNYAFAYISPDDYEIGPMPDIPEKTISDFTALKERNPDVVLGVSLGGWTFNDNKTDTQIVFAELSSTTENRAKFIKNLLSFMRHYGFNAVDLDWEYPGAPDRQPEDWDSSDDGKNYVKLMKDIRKAFDDEGLNYELSFTAPTSYWYLRWFEIQEMVDAVDYVNLMSYDLHGEWDHDNPIGNQVLGHTNLTEINQALDLLWRNKVPARKVNMGLAFYARTFELKDKKCNKPGCEFKHGGKKGACTDTEGILAYSEIIDIIAEDDITPVYDKENAVKYIVWDENQWISYDDQQTFQQKIKFFNEKGLGGLLIWAIDQDDRNRDALRGVLYPQDLVMTDSLKDDVSYWESQHPGDCQTTACGKHCSPGWIEMDSFECPDGGDKGDQRICCPMAAAPDPATCHWKGSPHFCDGQCEGGEVALASATHGGNGDCWDGRQQYCCPIPEVAAGGGINCGWKDKCSDDQELMTFAGTFLSTVSDVLDFTGLVGQALGDVLDDINMENYKPYCCSKEEIKNWKNCYWAGRGGRGAHSCDDAHCATGHEVELTKSPYGEGEDCWLTGIQRTFCCEPESGESLFLPVPLDYLFENAPDSDDPDFNLQVDDTWGTGETLGDAEEEPDDAAFGFVVITAPDEVHVSLDKRDGSPWELMGCLETNSEQAQTIRMICTDTRNDNNCDHIHRGYGVPGTILQMPERCGAGRYAVAKSFEESTDQNLPGYLNKRDLQGRSIYDLTFDYDFKRVPRDFGDAQMRIDFSNQPGYWDSVVDRPGGEEAERHARRAKRNESGYRKNRKRWMEDEWRDAYHNRGVERDELHKRWFGEDVINWLAQMIFVGEAEVTKELNHHVNEKVELILIDEQFGPCPVGPAQAQANIRSTITAEIDVETSFGFTIITTLQDGLDLSRSYLYFRNAGEVNAKFELDAVASLTYETGDIKLLGLDDFPGATFRVPGVVTIGPNLAVYASADASLVVAGHLEAAVTLASWEIQQTYPQEDEYPPQALDEPDREAKTVGKPTFDASVTASGEIAIHLKPTVTFGIVFDDRWNVEKCAVDLVLDGYVIGHAEAKYELNGDNSCPFTYGIDAGSDVYAQLTAPEIFGWGGNKRINLASVPRKQITPSTCPGDSDTKSRRWMDHVPGNWSGEYLSDHGSELMPMPRALEKRDTLTLGPLVTIPESFLKCPGEDASGGSNVCVMCSMAGEGNKDNDDDEKGSGLDLIRRQDDEDSCATSETDPEEHCSDSSVLSRADPITPKEMTVTFLNGGKTFEYLKYPRCNAKDNGPSNVAKWYLPEFMLATPGDTTDKRACSTRTVKQNTQLAGNGEHQVNGLSRLPATDFVAEHVFETHLVKHFMEWVCGTNGEIKYSGLKVKLDFPTGWTRPDKQWCTAVFGGPSGGMQWNRDYPSRKPKDEPNKNKLKNFVQHTADVMGSKDNPDLLVLYHTTPNGVKDRVLEGKYSSIKGPPKAKMDTIMNRASVFDYLETLKDKWMKPGQDIELISDEFDRAYTSQHSQKSPAGTALKKPDKPRGVKSWGLRTLWCYWIDRHLAMVDKVQVAWYSTAKTRAQANPAVPKEFLSQTMKTGAAALSKFQVPKKNAGSPLPGEVSSADNQKSRYGMWGDNGLRRLGL